MQFDSVVVHRDFRQFVTVYIVRTIAIFGLSPEAVIGNNMLQH